MSAATTECPMPDIQDGAKIRAIPMAAGAKVYKGRKAGITKAGYLENITPDNIAQIRQVVLVLESFDNTAGTNGTISGGDEKGERCVKCYVSGIYREENCSGLSQLKVGMPLYVHNNNDVDSVFLSGAFFGVLVKYIGSATVGYIEFGENLLKCGREFELKVPLTAAADGTGGGVLNMLNPFGVDVIVDDLVLDITTAPTDTAGGVDAGIAATGTSNDTLIDGAVLASAKLYDNRKNAGTNGGRAKWSSTTYLTITSVVGSHLDLAAMVGNAIIKGRIA